MEITIKPHHFIDIIKLYGSGIEVFVPDETMKHDFYRVANRILADHKISLKLTTSDDDICAPCIMCRSRECTDRLTGIPGYESKKRYNELLDNRVIDRYGLDTGRLYTAEALCTLMLEGHEQIFSIWQQENDETTAKRHRLFVIGAEKFLSRRQDTQN